MHLAERSRRYAATDAVCRGAVPGGRRDAGRRPGLPSTWPGSNRAPRTRLPRGGRCRPEHRSLVKARLSGGVGTPSGAPDVLGLALKIPLDPPDVEWDLLLASLRHLGGDANSAAPRTGLGSARYSSLMPYASNGTDAQWVLAVPMGPSPATTSLDSLRQSLTDAPLRFRLHLVSATGSPVPAGAVTLTTGAGARGRRTTDIRAGTPPSAGPGAAPRMARRRAGKRLSG